MRTMFVLRGAPGCGKSTWIKDNGLTPYTLEADNLRLLWQGPVLKADGEFAIGQNNDRKVWNLLHQMLEERMERGEFIVVDATHYKSTLLNQYKKLIAHYRYRAYVVDFTNVPLETLLERNAQREPYKRVPEEVIRKMAAVFEKDEEVSSTFTVVTPEDAAAKLQESLLFDYNRYNKMVVFGDIHGCFEPLKQYFAENPFDENTAYIFVGDYLDRGIQNKEVVEFLLGIYKNKNVLLLEGNHEKWLRMYADDEGAEVLMNAEDEKVLRKFVDKDFFIRFNRNKIRNFGFIQNTMPQLAGFKKKDLRQLCRKFGQMAYVEFRGKKYFISHGGIPVIPTVFVNSSQMVDGTGKFEDLDTLYAAWKKNTDGNTVLVHGHRNVFEYPAKIGDTIYNLCSDVELGASLRVLEIAEESVQVKEFANPVFDEKLVTKAAQVDVLPTKTDNELLRQLNNSDLVKKKLLQGGIVSYNFTRDAFYQKQWNELTCTARGLFVDNKTEKVICRSYNKFFNWGEVEATRPENLKKTLVFPVTAYKKENGFLAMVSYDWNKEDLMVCSKSVNTGEFVGMIKEALDSLGDGVKEKLKAFARENNCSFVFECVNQDKDPHIIRYDKNVLFLLDIVENSFYMNRKPYAEVRQIAADMGLTCKSVSSVFETWEALYDFVKEQDRSDTIRYEGWVFEDANGFMVKYKSRFYRFWKQMRAVKQAMEMGHTLKKTFTNEAEVRIYNLMKQLYMEGKLEGMSIIDVEEAYYSLQDKQEKEQE